MINNVFFCYASTTDVEAYAAPSAIFVTGRGNRYAPEFQRARDKGSKVYAYLAPISRSNSTSDPVDLSFYMGDISKVPLWGNGRRNNTYSMMTDLRTGSQWADWVVDYVGKLIIEGRVDGVFMDVLGARPWGAESHWNDWPLEERLEWTNGAVDLARRLDEKRRELNDRFEIVHNNVWQLDRRGEQYCDGVCMEHSPLSEFHTQYVGRAFGNLGHRRVLVIARTAVDAAQWKDVPGVTHLTAVDTALGQTYAKATPPLAPYNDLRLVEERAYTARLRFERDTLREALIGKAEEISALSRTRDDLQRQCEQITAVQDELQGQCIELAAERDGATANLAAAETKIAAATGHVASAALALQP